MGKFYYVFIFTFSTATIYTKYSKKEKKTNVIEENSRKFRDCVFGLSEQAFPLIISSIRQFSNPPVALRATAMYKAKIFQFTLFSEFSFSSRILRSIGVISP